MKSFHRPEGYFLFLLAVFFGSRVNGESCPQGQVTHLDSGQTMCCLPVECEPNHYLVFCAKNGTEDTCKLCQTGYKLLKRTSSFAVENCHVFPLDHNCNPLPGSLKPSKEDRQNCYCDLEKGEFFMEPQVALGPSSYCQPKSIGCGPGSQPNQSGQCEPCPKNTVQDLNDSFRLCRPQRNCTAMGLATDNLGSTVRETICAKPPVLPSKPPTPDNKMTSSPALPVTLSTATTTTPLADMSVRPSLERTPGNDSNLTLIVVLVAVVILILIGLAALILYRRRKRWFAGQGYCCHHDVEITSCPGNQFPMPNREDNGSDNSCCACTDSCLSSSSKSGSGGAGPCSSGQTKPQTKLEAFMNGSAPQKALGDDSMSEPFYNSISHDGSKLSNGNMACYTNVNGIAPTLLRSEDFYNYPNKVHIPSGNDDDDDDGMTKDQDGKFKQIWGKGNDAKGSKDFKETDPLLLNSENPSSGGSTPLMPPVALRSILRNGNNWREPNRGGERPEETRGNRPHLSLLLSSGDESSGSANSASQLQNLPYLSQLMSNQQSFHGPGSNQAPPLHHQQLQQQVPEAPQECVHELPQQLQQHLLQQQQLQQQQFEGSTLAARLAPTVPISSAPEPHLNPSLVQMEELKPVMPLNPENMKPANTASKGAKNVEESRVRTGSPARISPSQQEEVRANTGREAVKMARSSASSANASTGAIVEKDCSEQTFRKQSMPGVSSVNEEDETAHKSVAGSSGLGESLDISSAVSTPDDEGRRSRLPYRRSVSEVSRSVSPSLPLPPSRSISSPEEKHRPFAVVKPMQSDQSLNISSSQDQLMELTHPLDVIGRHFPLHSLRSHTTGRQSSQESSDDPDLTRPKTPDCLSEDENEENEAENAETHVDSDGRTRVTFSGDNDIDLSVDDQEDGSDEKDRSSHDGGKG